MAAMGQRDPHMEMAPLHEEINTLTSKKLWISSTESVCHQRASNILDFQKRLQVAMESVNIHIGKHRPAVNAQDGAHRKLATIITTIKREILQKKTTFLASFSAHDARLPLHPITKDAKKYGLQNGVCDLVLLFTAK